MPSCQRVLITLFTPKTGDAAVGVSVRGQSPAQPARVPGRLRRAVVPQAVRLPDERGRAGGAARRARAAPPAVVRGWYRRVCLGRRTSTACTGATKASRTAPPTSWA
jgi:hypothetical protein